MKQKSTRQYKVASEIKKVVSEFMMRNSVVDSKNSQAALASVTDVEVSPCLQHAKIFVSHTGGNLTDEDILLSLENHSPKIRYHVGHEIKLRFVPELHFFIDDTYERAKKIDALLEQISVPKFEKEPDLKCPDVG